MVLNLFPPGQRAPMSHLADTPVSRSFPQLKQIPDPLVRYAAALLLLALLTGLAFLTRFAFGFGASVLYGLFYFIAILGAAWLGYGQGLLICTLLTFVVAPWFATRPVRFRPLDLGRFAVLLAFSLVVSTISFLVRRRQEELMRAAEELEGRVRLGTEEARRSADARREIERSVREQAQLLDLAHDAIFSLDSDGTIRFWNSGAEQMYGWSRDEATGRRSHDLLQTEFPAPLEQIEEKLRVSGRWQGELIHTHRDGTHLRVLSRWALRTGPDGQPAGFLEINTDITEKRRIEEQLRHTQKLESLGVLAGGVAHDFNNLLTGIMGNASLALEDLKGSPVQPRIAEIIAASDRGALLVRQMLAYAGKGRFVMERLNLSRVVSELEPLIRTSIPRTVDLALRLDPTIPYVEGDPSQMQQLILNLAINAGEAIGEAPGAVAIETARRESDAEHQIVLTVRDNGCGMDETTRARMFDPFFTTKFTGRGLGLAAVNGIVRAHRGTISVETAPGSGTTMTVVLPACDKIEGATPEPQSDLRGYGNVLVVDDEDMIRNMARFALERCGYTVEQAADGRAAVAAVTARPSDFAAVLLDLTMPVMSGEEALIRIREIRPDLPVLLSSGFSEAEALKRFANRGLAGFLQKPYTATALARKVKVAVRQTRKSVG